MATPFVFPRNNMKKLYIGIMTSSHSLLSSLVLNFCVVSLLPPICMSLCFSSTNFSTFEHVRNILFYSFLLLQSFPVFASCACDVPLLFKQKERKIFFNLFFVIFCVCVEVHTKGNAMTYNTYQHISNSTNKSRNAINRFFLYYYLTPSHPLFALLCVWYCDEMLNLVNGKLSGKNGWGVTHLFEHLSTARAFHSNFFRVLAKKLFKISPWWQFLL